MLYAVIADVNANLEAFEVVVSDIKSKKIEDIVFLGDAVGYGPNPNECVELLSRCCKIMVAGNHDWAALGLTDIFCFNDNAQCSLEWTVDELTEKNRKILNASPINQVMKDGTMVFVHATPKDPEEWHYLLKLLDAEINFRCFKNQFCFLGHSHQPFIVGQSPSGEMFTYKESVNIKNSYRYIINVGSVGQPRDGDPRACYAIIDNNKIMIVRVPYNIDAVQMKMKKRNFPLPLIERLSIGR